MSVQIVHDLRDLLGLGIASLDLSDESRPVGLCLAIGGLDHSPASQRLIGHENVAHATALVLVVVTRGTARPLVVFSPLRCRADRP